jgi:hypothetical protein
VDSFFQKDGFYFYFGRGDEIYTVGTSLKKLPADLGDVTHYKTPEEGGWQEVPQKRTGGGSFSSRFLMEMGPTNQIYIEWNGNKFADASQDRYPAK